MIGSETRNQRLGTKNRRGIGTTMANQLGKMYLCSKCGSQVIVTKGGTGTLKCCGQGMEQKK